MSQGRLTSFSFDQVFQKGNLHPSGFSWVFVTLVTETELGQLYREINP